jgi:pimeloyl-ACP methyl ester carboxylesterase
VVFGKRLSPIARDEPRKANLRRAYFDCRYGQLHVRTAFPGGGGFDERTTLVILHDAGGSSRDLLPWVRELGEDRSVYAPDFPGHGESDGTTAVAGEALPVLGVANAAGIDEGLDSAAAAVFDFCMDLRLRGIHLLAVGAGVEVARRVTAAREGLVARLVEAQPGDSTAAVRARLDAPG